jgi:hypothetical protein
MPPGFYLVPRLQDVTTFRDCIKFQSLLRSAGNCELTTGLHGGFFLPGADFGRREAGNPDFKIFAGLLIAGSGVGVCTGPSSVTLATKRISGPAKPGAALE